MNDEVQQIDVERVMERIRENIRRRRSAGDIPAPEHDTSPFADDQVAADLAYLHSGYDITDVSLVSHRRILGSLVLAAKKVFRKLLAPVLERQVAYNAASTRVTTHLKDWVEAQRQIGDTLREDMVALAARLRAERAELRAELRAAESRVGQALAQALSRQAGIGEEQCQGASSSEAGQHGGQRTDLQGRTDDAPGAPRFPDPSVPGARAGITCRRASERGARGSSTQARVRLSGL